MWERRQKLPILANLSKITKTYPRTVISAWVCDVKAKFLGSMETRDFPRWHSGHAGLESLPGVKRSRALNAGGESGEAESPVNEGRHDRSGVGRIEG